MPNLRDLIEAGHVNAGEQLEWVRPLKGLRYTAVIGELGIITTSDGAEHKSPSGAARHFYKKPIDGWSAWRIIRNGKSLAEIRAQFSK
jgi:hypothetical protein